MVSGRVTRDREVHCGFKHNLIVRRVAEEQLVYQTGCILDPGTYELTVAVLDRDGMQLGARRSPLLLESARPRRGIYLSEVYLWVQDYLIMTVTAGAEEIGLSDRAGKSEFIPYPERRFDSDQSGVLSFFVCKPPASGLSGRSSVQVIISILDERAVKVHKTTEHHISATDADDACNHLAISVPPGSLRAGIYTLDISVLGRGSPVNRRAHFAVQ